MTFQNALKTLIYIYIYIYIYISLKQIGVKSCAVISHHVDGVMLKRPEPFCPIIISNCSHQLVGRGFPRLQEPRERMLQHFLKICNRKSQKKLVEATEKRADCE